MYLEIYILILYTNNHHNLFLIMIEPVNRFFSEYTKPGRSTCSWLCRVGQSHTRPDPRDAGTHRDFLLIKACLIQGLTMLADLHRILPMSIKKGKPGKYGDVEACMTGRTDVIRWMRVMEAVGQRDDRHTSKNYYVFFTFMLTLLVLRSIRCHCALAA